MYLNNLSILQVSLICHGYIMYCIKLKVMFRKNNIYTNLERHVSNKCKIYKSRICIYFKTKLVNL